MRIDETTTRILNEKSFESWHAQFLIEIDRDDLASSYIIRLNDSIDGGMYGSITALAKYLEQTNPLAASVLYRKLLISLLDRGYAKAYHHGVKYLKKLDKLCTKVRQWDQRITPHPRFKAELRESHGRKHSFWSKYAQSV